MGVGMGWEAAKSHIPGVSPDLPRASVPKPGLPEHGCLKPSDLWEVYSFCLFVCFVAPTPGSATGSLLASAQGTRHSHQGSNWGHLRQSNPVPSLILLSFWVPSQRPGEKYQARFFPLQCRQHLGKCWRGFPG